MHAMKELLRLLTNEFPPPTGMSHAALFIEDGIKLSIVDSFRDFHLLALEERDLDRPVLDLFSEIGLMLNAMGFNKTSAPTSTTKH